MQKMSPSLLLRKRMSKGTLEEGNQGTQAELQIIPSHVLSIFIFYMVRDTEC